MLLLVCLKKISENECSTKIDLPNRQKNSISNDKTVLFSDIRFCTTSYRKNNFKIRLCIVHFIGVLFRRRATVNVWQFVVGTNWRNNHHRNKRRLIIFSNIRIFYLKLSASLCHLGDIHLRKKVYQNPVRNSKSKNLGWNVYCTNQH